MGGAPPHSYLATIQVDKVPWVAQTGVMQFCPEGTYSSLVR